MRIIGVLFFDVAVKDLVVVHIQDASQRVLDGAKQFVAVRFNRMIAPPF